MPEPPPRRELDPPRERDPPLRELPELRLLDPREDFAVPPLERFALLFAAVGLRAPEERLEPVPDDFARDDVDFFAPPLEREPVDREPLEREREADDLRGDDLRVDDLRELLRDDDDDPDPPLTTDSTSAVHLPDSTR